MNDSTNILNEQLDYTNMNESYVLFLFIFYFKNCMLLWL